MGLIYTSLLTSLANITQVHSTCFPGEIRKGSEIFLSLCIWPGSPCWTHLAPLMFVHPHARKRSESFPWKTASWNRLVPLWFLPLNSYTSGCWPYSLSLERETEILFYTLEYLIALKLRVRRINHSHTTELKWQAAKNSECSAQCHEVGSPPCLSGPKVFSRYKPIYPTPVKFWEAHYSWRE